MVVVLINKIDEVLRKVTLNLQVFQFLGKLHAGGDIRLAIGLHVDNVVPLLETHYLLGDLIDVTLQIGDTLIDILSGILQDAFLVLHRVFIVHFDQGVEYISRTSRGRVGDGEADNGVFLLVVGINANGPAVHVGDVGYRKALYVDRDVVERLVIIPSIGDAHLAHGCIDRIAHMHGHGRRLLVTLKLREDHC